MSFSSFLKKSVIQLEISLFLIQWIVAKGVRMVCVGNTRNCWSTHRPACHLPVSSLGHAEMIEEGGVELQQGPGSTGLVLQPLVSPWDVLLWQYLHHMLCCKEV